jgi:hypothetical protein
LGQATEDSHRKVTKDVRAHSCPGALDLEEARRRLRRFVAVGVRQFIDLTEVGELEPYAELLTEESGSRTSYERFPIHDGNVPDEPKTMAEIIAAIDRAIAKGGITYVHCWGGVGRTGLTVTRNGDQQPRHRSGESGASKRSVQHAGQRLFQVGGDPNAESALFVCIVVCAVPLNALVPLMRERCRRNSVSQPSSHVRCRSSAIDHLKPARRFVTGTYSQQQIPPDLQPAPFFTPTPKAAKRVLEFFTGQINKLEVAQHIANHESPRTMKLYDRRQDEISLDEIERIAI